MALIKDKILVIEDEKSISYLLGTVLTANGYDVIKAYTEQRPVRCWTLLSGPDPAGPDAAGDERL